MGKSPTPKLDAIRIAREDQYTASQKMMIEDGAPPGCMRAPEAPGEADKRLKKFARTFGPDRKLKDPKDRAKPAGLGLSHFEMKSSGAALKDKTRREPMMSIKTNHPPVKPAAPKAEDVSDIPFTEMTGDDLRKQADRPTPPKSGTVSSATLKEAEAKKAAATAPAKPKAADAANKQETTVTSTSVKTPTARKPASKKLQAAAERARGARRPKAKAKAAAPTKPRKPSDEGPSGKAQEIGKLAARPNGASRDELVELTGWKQQAWKWYFVNSKDTGFCQRFGYKLEVIEGKDGETRYKITKK